MPFFPGGKSIIDNIGFNYFGIGGDPRLRPHVVGFLLKIKQRFWSRAGFLSLLMKTGSSSTIKNNSSLRSLPSIVELVFPYFLCILPTHVEVRNIETFTLLQTLDIPDVLYISIGKHDAYLATSHEVYQLAFTDLKQQIVTLSNHKGHLLEAICLVDHINHAILPEKLSLLRELKIHSCNRSVFQKKRKRYMQALAILSEVSAPPTMLLSFFHRKFQALLFHCLII